MRRRTRRNFAGFARRRRFIKMVGAMSTPRMEKLTVATTRIHRLIVAGLTLEMIGADFIHRRIAPLHNKGRPAWLFRNAADIMRGTPTFARGFFSST